MTRFINIPYNLPMFLIFDWDELCHPSIRKLTLQRTALPVEAEEGFTYLACQRRREIVRNAVSCGGKCQGAVYSTILIRCHHRARLHAAQDLICHCRGFVVAVDHTEN